MDYDTMYKLAKIVNKMHNKDDYSYNKKIILKNKSFLDSTTFMYDVIDAVMDFDIAEEKILAFLIVLRNNFSEQVDFFGKNNSIFYSQIFYKAAIKNFNLSFFNQILEYSLKKMVYEQGYPKKKIEAFLNHIYDQKNTFVHMIMNNLVKKGSKLADEEIEQLKKLFDYLNEFNYNFLLPDSKNLNLCDYVNIINDNIDSKYCLNRSFYDNFKDAIMYKLGADDIDNKMTFILFFGFSSLVDEDLQKIGEYINSYRQFEDKKYSYTVNEFGKSFGLLLNEFSRNHFSYFTNEELFEVIVKNVRYGNVDLLIEILNQCVINGYKLNFSELLTNKIFTEFEKDKITDVYKFLCDNGFNSFDSISDRISKRFDGQCADLYCVQSFFEDVKSQFDVYAINYNLDFYSVYDDDKVLEFSKFINDTVVFGNYSSRYELADRIVGIIREYTINSVNKIDDVITIEDILNAMKRIISENYDIYLNKIDTYKQKVLTIKE